MRKEERIRHRDWSVIGYNIQRLREKNGLRNIDPVAKLRTKGIPISTPSKIELGNENPSTILLVTLHKILKCDYNELFQTPVL